MKYILTAIFCLFVASTSNAMGKLSLQNNLYQDGKGGHTYRPMIGLSVYEFIIGKKVAFSSWTGYGNQFLELSEDVNWLSTKNQLDFFVGRFTLAPGIQYSYIPTFKDHRMMPYLKVDMRLW